MNSINPKKLLNSKWTAVSPKNKEKHFLISKVKYSDEGIVIDCLIEAVMTKKTYNIIWSELKDKQSWLSGWQQ